MQMVEISSAKCGWKKQGGCKVVDDEPPPPTEEPFASDRGWKQVTGFKVAQGGADYLFPSDQLLVVTEDGYKPIKNNEHRLLGSLKAGKVYLVWWHHILRTSVLAERRLKVTTKKRRT
jgi:hypothetical protein